MKNYTVTFKNGASFIIKAGDSQDAYLRVLDKHPNEDGVNERNVLSSVPIEGDE